MFYYIRKTTAKKLLIDETVLDYCDTFHKVYAIAYEMAQNSKNSERIEIWQNYFNKDKQLCTIIRIADPPTESKKKYDQRTGISFYSEI